ncbi:MAG: 2-octaprenyl-6-methoxyphenyl hydroxylase [Panacagrimonas sp.]|jgi:2-octaprenyl-6-methoxyphenol hydroxylase|nr:2-octaprenyl-6-methoxyphenyl hydroxylase [Panacagrimonas sp.]MCC2655763.1 2-octaprenyl-6-methoxyphenyl hydroxylase [Panacagrimonas sp.]
MTAAATFDVAIVGGGLVGCSLAAALSRTVPAPRVALIEAMPIRTSAPAWDERCIALNAGSRRILEAIGAWDALSHDAEPILSTHISERGRFGAARFTAEQAGLPALGYNTPLRAINDSLWAHARAAGVTVLCPARLTSLETLADHVHLRLEDDSGPSALRARLLVAADGARSAVRAALALSAETREYEQTALVTAIRTRHPHGGVAYERFLPTGPLAVLPKPRDAAGHACSLVWTVPTAQVAELEALDDATLLSRASTQFGERLGAFLSIGRRQSHPLSRVMNEQLRAPRTVFVGNAAQSLHPVAAQGFNLGLRDAATLAELLAEGGDPGSEARLEAYESQRRRDRTRTADFTDGLVRLFSNSLPGLRGLRHLGLLLLELDTPARDAILRQNLGFGGPVPALARRP